MDVVVNGKSRAVASGATVLDLLAQLDLSHERIAIEHNCTILDVSEYATASLAEGDTLEIVRFVGGG